MNLRFIQRGSSLVLQQGRDFEWVDVPVVDGFGVILPPPGATGAERLRKVSDALGEIEPLRKAVAAKDEEIARLRKAVNDREEDTYHLRLTMDAQGKEIKALHASRDDLRRRLRNISNLVKDAQ